MNSVESNDANIASIFRDFYVVPSYQREYVWGQDQVLQLLNDIRCEQVEGRDSEYFIGSIVVCPSQSHEGAYDLIDGQQRTTTLFIILCTIRDRLRALGDTATNGIEKLIADTVTDFNGNDSFRPRLDPQYNDAGDVFQNLLAGKAPKTRGTRSMVSIAIAYNSSMRFLVDEFGDDTREVRAFFAYLVHKVKLIRIRTDSIARALKIFETINDRGIGLDAMDLLKNLLFMRTPTERFDKLKDHWKRLIDKLHRAKEKPLRFLRYYVLATWGITKLREDELYDWFVKNEEKVGFSKNPIAFVAELEEALDAYLNFHRGKGKSGEDDAALESLHLLAGSATRQHLIMLMAGRNLPADVFARLCADTEALLFTYLITRQTNREFEVMFPEWAPALAQISSIEEYEEFSEKTLRKRRRELSQRFRREFQALNGQTVRQYQLRYILGKLTQAVDKAAYGETAQTGLWLSRYCDGANVHIEHILPQTPNEEVFAEFGPEADNQDLLWSIGNLALVEKSINASLGRQPFSRKRRFYPQSQFLLTRIISEKPAIGRTAIDRAVDNMTPFEQWGPNDIAQRAAWLTDFACAVWEVPVSSVLTSDEHLDNARILELN